MRISHLDIPGDIVKAGVYACSPMKGSFYCRVCDFQVEENQWNL